MRKIKWCVLVFLAVVGSSALAGMTGGEGLPAEGCNDTIGVGGLLVEHQSAPMGIGVLRPSLSWQLRSAIRGTRQTAYAIRVGRKISDLEDNSNLIWESGKTMSEQSVYVVYGGRPPGSGERLFWQVRVWDNFGHVSPWSAAASWQMGLLKASDWLAKWIEADCGNESCPSASPLFRRVFQCGKVIRSATAFVTAHGLYEAYINGHRVGDLHLTPGWTSYNRRLQYQIYDVTDLIGAGQNAIGLMVGSGWYRSTLGWGKVNRNIYGKELGVLFQMKIEYADGTTEWVISGEGWKSSAGAIRSSEIYDGEVNDARLDKKGWTLASYDDAGWQPVRLVKADNSILTVTYNEGVREHETFTPVRIFSTPDGDRVADFGQNMAGFVRVRVRGRRGDTLTVDHAEVLDKAGNFYNRNYRTARSANSYVLAGDSVEYFEPHFTFQGFRYIRMRVVSGDLKVLDLQAVALYSDMKPSGTFRCSNPLLNQLQQNIQWGQRGNFLDVPTDCPQRDERLGWTGDAQVFAATAAYNMSVYNFFAKWLKDVAADQFANGSMPYVIPHVLDSTSSGSTGWGDAATIIPWQMYLSYGDKRILKDQYGSMRAWVEYMRRNSRNGCWNTGFHIGDWLSYHPEADYDGRSAVTDKYLIAQCFFAYSTQLLVQTAHVLGKPEEEHRYADLLRRIRTAFLREYVSPNGRLSSATQTAYVLALHCDMLPERLRPEAVRRLLENIKSYDGHLTTGFLGTPYLCGVLSRYGHTDAAYRLLLQESYPSWLYPVKQGATTIWERWDGIRPDGTFQDPDMNSFNHYAYGAIGNWMYTTIAGINTDDVVTGYKKIIIRPRPGGGLTSASATLETYYGKISTEWELVNGAIRMKVTIPPNTSATVYVPTTDAHAVRNGGKRERYQVKRIGAGEYRFEAPCKSSVMIDE